MKVKHRGYTLEIGMAFDPRNGNIYSMVAVFDGDLGPLCLADDFKEARAWIDKTCAASDQMLKKVLT